MPLHHIQLSFCPPAACLRVTGDDAFLFLQGQFTNQLNIPVGRSVYGLWLTQKGKVLADSFVLRFGEKEFFVVSPGSPVEAIRERLEAYIIADDVALSDETLSLSGLAIFGEGSAELLRATVGGCPERGQFLRLGDLCVFEGRRSAEAAYEVVGSKHAIEACRQQFVGAGAVECSAARVEALRIEAGIPDIPRDIGPNDLPNEGGLEGGAISYTKGCYLGQEVMSRLKNLGQVRRRLHRVRGSGEAPVTGASVYQGTERVGELRTVAKSGTGFGFVAMAMLSLVKYQSGANLSLAPDAPATLAVTAL